MRISDRFTLGLACLLVVGVCGCQSADEGVPVYGSVTFNGSPVPVGLVVFQPDVGKGNRGRQGFAEIRDGKFDTRIGKGRGTVSGAVKVLVSGGDGVGIQLMEPFGKLLFDQFQLSIDLPAEGQELTIDVPAKPMHRVSLRPAR